MYDRYSRQILFKQIGAKGQAEIRKKHVLILEVLVHLVLIPRKC